jgi:hypothetical protein
LFGDVFAEVAVVEEENTAVVLFGADYSANYLVEGFEGL